MQRFLEKEISSLAYICALYLEGQFSAFQKQTNKQIILLYSLVKIFETTFLLLDSELFNCVLLK